MVELHIYRGIPGSGKSTLAEKLAAQDGGRLVGRDRIRKLLGVGHFCTSAQTHEISETQGRLIVQGLKDGQNVHVDDMNLKSPYVRRLLYLANRFKADVVVHDLSTVPLETCLQWNKDRAERTGGFVNEEAIRKYWERFIKPTKGRGLPMPDSGLYDARMNPPDPYVPDTNLGLAILVDLDGTVAIRGNRGFHDYDDRVLTDTPNKNVVCVVRALIHRNIRAIYVSGRKGNTECRLATEQWIGEHIQLGRFDLYMREPHDNRPDYLVKRDIFDQHIRNNWNVLGAIDDRRQVVDMYRDLGLTVFQVAAGEF
jgi:predicted kinase